MNRELLYQNKKICYRIIGEGNPVILIHGFGEEAEVWNNQVEFLQNKFQLIVPDLPGSGQSEMIDDMSMEGMAEVIHSIIHEENIEACPVIGHSMGGYITLAFAEKYWNHLTAFGLFHSSAFADSDEKKETRKKGIDFITKNGEFEFLKTATPNLYSPETKEKNPQLVEKQIESLHNFSEAALVSYYASMMQRPDRTEILNTTTVPVLFIAGKYDNAVPLADVLKQCFLPSLAYIHILEHSGHMGMQEEPNESNEILLNFVKSIHP